MTSFEGVWQAGAEARFGVGRFVGLKPHANPKSKGVGRG